jgi:hypothetical protein
MQYQKAFDIWAMPTSFYKFIQPGQWVYAGDKGNIGRFYGVKNTGVVVVAWLGNARKHPKPSEYFKTIHTFAGAKHVPRYHIL